MSSLSDHFVSASGQDHATPSDFSHTPSRSTKLVSVFERLSSVEIEREKQKSMQPLHRLPKDNLEIQPEEFNQTIEFPKRPAWNYEMSKEQVEQREQESFDSWMKQIEETYGQDQQLSWFERNLEVWRQLWRVLEISDVIVLVMDIRNPLLHFPRSLYHYVTQTLKRKMIGVFNKVDLVAEFTVFAWRKYFEEQFPELHIATFSCYPRDSKLIDDTTTYALKNQAKRPKKRYYYAQGVKDILGLCRDVIDKPDVQVDWHTMIAQYDHSQEEMEYDDSDSDSDTGSMDGLDDEFSRILEITGQEIKPHHDYITLGLVGHPNVGKSSLINSIMKRTVVSASRTPGHTKHFQTIHISPHVRLCDSPGLVFPALIPKTLQILSGMYPIAQVQEPYSAIRYLAERIPLEKVLSLTPPCEFQDMKHYQWTTWSICEQFAEQRGFFTAKAARPDVYRAANTILRLTTDGRILLSFKPPGFFHSTKYEKLRVIEADKASPDDTEDEEEEEERENLLVSKGGRFNVLVDFEN
ncbi:Guanine nucleotide-binding protein-like 1 [Choanephora cucurbitarum]|uniref:Guanine nucleotide-binding protein-like 1 n=1 Tax=Choanephora cucurbitarum TaxID=101091 RepID=A0A1C7NJ19_9FUNG|nr:Guanine nucleotide-binding protein-like 1 [Choanephora cucurbitarum]